MNYTPADAAAAFQVLRDHLDGAEFNYDAQPDRLLLMMGVTGSNHRFKVAAHVGKALPDFSLYIDYGILVPKDQRREMCELLTRINWAIRVGRFELDHSDGQVRLSLTHLFPGTLDEETLHRLMGTCFQTADHYAPAILGVSYGGRSAADAFAKADDDDEP